MNRIAFVFLCSMLGAATVGATDAPVSAGAAGESPAVPQAAPTSEQAPDNRRSTPLPSEPDSSAALNAAASAESDSKKGTGGVFLPSEEISEDFAVSFPVDI